MLTLFIMSGSINFIMPTKWNVFLASRGKGYQLPLFFIVPFSNDRWLWRHRSQKIMGAHRSHECFVIHQLALFLLLEVMVHCGLLSWWPQTLGIIWDVVPCVTCWFTKGSPGRFPPAFSLLLLPVESWK